MEDMRNSRSVPAMQALAALVRQFDGSRVERQVLAQAFDIVWQIEREAAGRIGAAVAHGERASGNEYPARVAAPGNRSRHCAEAVAGQQSEKGGTS